MPNVATFLLRYQLLYSMCMVSLFGYVKAEVSHTVTVSLPRHLLVDLDVTGFVQNVAVSERDTSQLLNIRSSSAWQLAASFIPCRENDQPHLTVATSSKTEARPLKFYPRVIATSNGRAAQAQVDIRLDFSPPVSDAPCHSLLLYTFVQP